MQQQADASVHTLTRLRFTSQVHSVVPQFMAMNSHEYEYDLIVNIDTYLYKLMAGWAADRLTLYLVPLWIKIVNDYSLVPRLGTSIYTYIRG